MAANTLDRVISWLSPRAGVNRLRARAAFDLVQRHYEGASIAPRTGGWQTFSTSANGASQDSLQRLRDRSRDLTRNNPYASKALSVITTNTVGTGIVPQAKAGARGNRARAVMDLWAAHCETTAIDVDERMDFYGLEALVLRTVAEAGECLVRRIWRRLGDGYAVPLQLQVLEPEYLDTSADTWGARPDGTRIVQGIKYDARGRVLGYMIHNQHPGDVPIRAGLSSTLVDAADILHVFRSDRPGQGRGVPWAAPVIIRLRDFDEYEDAQRVRQKLAACYTAFVRNSGEGLPNEAVAKPEKLPETMGVGTFEYLQPGEEIEFANPPTVSGYGEYTTTILRSIASGYGITYEALTNDLSGVNFSSGRMGWLEFHRNLEAWRWHMLIPQFCDGVWRWFMEAAAVMGARTDGVVVQWTPPRREMIDPGKETKATVDAIRSGLISYAEAIRQAGYDPEVVMTEISESNTRIDALKLELDSDPRKMTAQGQRQQPAQGTPPANDNNQKGKAAA